MNLKELQEKQNTYQYLVNVLQNELAHLDKTHPDYKVRVTELMGHRKVLDEFYAPWREGINLKPEKYPAYQADPGEWTVN